MPESPARSGDEEPQTKPKKAGKRAALRPRLKGGNDLLSNPALSGAQTVVARSVLGQGTSPQPAAPDAAGERRRASPLVAEPPMPVASGAVGTGLNPSPQSRAADSTSATDVLPGIYEDEDQLNATGQLDQPDASTTPVGQRKRARAHETLLQSWRGSRVDLKLRKQTWQTHPFRFAPDLVTKLSRRVAQDCTSSGKTLTAAQYVDAAMSMYLPKTMEGQLKLAEEFLLSRDSDVGTGKQASHRVSPEVFEIAAPLANELRIAGRARIAVHVYSGALDRFLRDLEAEGPLRPTT